MKKITLAMLMMATVSTPALAGHSSKIAYAKVVDVDPIYRTIERREPQRECWTETVAYERSHRGHRSKTPTLVGAVIGGALGNELGHNSTNKKVGAVIGGLLGASIATDIHRRHRPEPSYTEYRDVERCETNHVTSYEEKVVGYDVTYKLRGETYQTRMDHHPGKKIKVAVDVRPVY